jgi:hypothetical protein
MTQSQKLAQLWVSLGPLGEHLGIEDPDLMMAIEDLNKRIHKHFNDFRLQAMRIR